MSNEEGGSDEMRIAVLAHALRVGGGLSVGQNLVSRLLRTKRPHKFLMVLPEVEDYQNLQLPKERAAVYFYPRRGGHAGRMLFDSFQLRRRLHAFQPDAVIGLGNRTQKVGCAITALYCQDSHLFYPEKHFAGESRSRKWLKRFQAMRLAHDLKFAELLLCQTHVARQRLLERYSFRGKVLIAPNALSLQTLATNCDGKVPTQIRPYGDRFRLFCLTRYYPHKNLEIILEILKRLGTESKELLFVLTIDADQHPHARKLLHRLKATKFNRSVLNVGPLPQEKLGAYYRACHAYFLPTLLESHSGAYLEAMHFGCPILTSNLDFARASCGDAALYFDPWNCDDVVESIRKVMGNEALREHLRRQGKARLAQQAITWEEIADELLDALEQIYVDRRRAGMAHSALRGEKRLENENESA